MLDKLQDAVGRISRYQWCAIALIISYVILSAIRLKLPGPQYDEFMFINTALGAKYDAFSSVRWFNVPVVMLPYVGALKSYLFWPIFHVLPASVAVIRGTSIFITAIGLWFMFRAGNYAGGKKLGLLFLVLMVFDPNFIGLVRLDVGPTMIETFCKFLTLFFLFKFLKFGQRRQFFWALAVMGVGLYNKLNFIWFISAISLATLMAYWPELKKLRKKTLGGWRSKIIIIGSYVAYVGYYLALSRYFKLKGQIGPAAVRDNWGTIWRSVLETVSGQSFSRYLFDYHVNSRLSALYLVAIGLVLLGGLGVFYLARFKDLLHIPRGIQNLYVFCGVALAATLGQVMITADAKNPWHYFTIFPFSSMLVGLSLFFCYRFIRDYRSQQTGKVIIGCAIGFLVLCQLFTTLKYISFYDSQLQNWYWSEATYGVIDYSKARTGHVASVDWGLHMQLLGLDNVPGKYLELWGSLNTNLTPAAIDSFAATYFSDPSTVYITRNPTRNPQASAVKVGPWPLTTVNFMKVVHDSGHQAHLERQFTNSRGEVVFEAYTVR